MDNSFTVSLDEAFTNIDTVCANATGTRQTHFVLMASIEVVKKELADRQQLIEALKKSTGILHAEIASLKPEVYEEAPLTSFPTAQGEQAEGEGIEGQENIPDNA